MKTVLEILKLSTEYLDKRGIASSRYAAESLLSGFLGIKRMDLYLGFERPLQENELQEFRKRLHRRGLGEPEAYIEGKVDFYGVELLVGPAVLIPRPETEILVDGIVQELSLADLSGKRCLDLCTGSGCIGLSLKKRFPDLEVVLTDLSQDAIAVASENAKRNQLNVEILSGDFLEPLKGRRFDFVVSNPPYVSLSEYAALSHEVRDFEPRLALLGGETGLEYYEKMAKELPLYLNCPGKVWLEIGAGQGASVLELFSDERWKRQKLQKDWAGHDRFISLEIE